MVIKADKNGATRERTLSESEERFRVIFDAISDAVFIHDPDTGAILDINHRACEMWGYSREEMVQKEMGDLSVNVPPFAQENALHWIRKASYKPQTFEWLCRDHAGRAFWVEISIRSITVAQQRFIVVAARDINIHKETEFKRWQAVASLDALFRAINDAICLLDLNGVVLQANHAMCHQLAMPRERVIGKKCHELMHDSSCFLRDCPMQRMIQSKHRESLELREGDQWFHVTTDPVLDEKGELIGAVHIVRDINEQKRLSLEREELLEKLQAANSEIVTLHGLLPICASCKNIRDDKGYWIQIESYIETRSEAHFSHGICPDCALKLYPDYFGDNKQTP